MQTKDFVDFVLYVWTGLAALVLVLSTWARYRTDSFDPIYRLYKGLQSGSLCMMLVGLGLILLRG